MKKQAKGTNCNGNSPTKEKMELSDLKDTPKIHMKKQINLFQAICIIVGIIIGSGIFVSPVGILANVKSVGMSCVMWTICGLFSTLCALCFAELGASIPKSGGEYTYIREAFGGFLSFLALWTNFIIICPVCVAVSCLIFAKYILRPAFPDCDPPIAAERLIAAAIIGKKLSTSRLQFPSCYTINELLSFNKA